jgi:hypothetical protein
MEITCNIHVHFIKPGKIIKKIFAIFIYFTKLEKIMEK